MPFVRVTVHCGKENNQTIQGLLDTGCEPKLFQENQNVTVALRSDWRLKVVRISQWPFSSVHSHSGASVSLNVCCGYFLTFRMNNWNRNTWQLAESPYWFPDLWAEECCGRKSQTKSIKIDYTQENSKPSQIILHILKN